MLQPWQKPQEIKEELYNSLRKVLCRVPSTDKLILAGDFDARVRKEMDKWPLVIGPHGVGKWNSNDELLLATLLGTQFGHHKHYLQTQGKSQDHMDAPRSKHWHLFRLYNSTAGRPKWHLEHKIHERRWLADCSNIPELLPNHPARLM